MASTTETNETATAATNGATPEAPPSPLAVLRRSFEPAHIGKLPRITCPNCRESRSKVCQDHEKERCSECGNYITKQHIHLDYVGHAEVTDRLLEADDHWNWRPMAREIDPAVLAAVASGTQIDPAVLRMVIENSPPKMDRDSKGQPIGMWIYLNVDGVERIGYGSVESNKFDAEKQLIGDALRNAGMRFGVALSLWSKGLLESEQDDDGRTRDRATGAASRSSESGAGPASAPSEPPPWWEEWGYADEDEMRSMNDSLKEILDAIPRERRDPVGTWLAENWYVRTNDSGEIVVQPLPVRKADVPAYRAVLVSARDGATGAAAPGEGPPEPPSPAAPDASMVELDELTKRVSPAELDEILATVKSYKLAELAEELSGRGFSASGNKETLGARLMKAMILERLAERSEGSATS